jgi:hypothetical protein
MRSKGDRDQSHKELKSEERWGFIYSIAHAQAIVDRNGEDILKVFGDIKLYDEFLKLAVRIGKANEKNHLRFAQADMLVELTRLYRLKFWPHLLKNKSAISQDDFEKGIDKLIQDSRENLGNSVSTANRKKLLQPPQDEKLKIRKRDIR